VSGHIHVNYVAFAQIKNRVRPLAVAILVQLVFVTHLYLYYDRQAKESDEPSDKWQQMYSKLAGNEIHSITACNSKFFQEFVGKSFVQASCAAHKK
jgi:hypothetical protein